MRDADYYAYNQYHNLSFFLEPSRAQEPVYRATSRTNTNT